MPFTIETYPIDQFTLIRITDTTTQAHIDISSKGGLLNSWVQSPDNKSWDVIDGNDFSNGWSNFEGTGFKSGKMNPFSCRLYKGGYEHDSNKYLIEKFYLGEHAIHGIIYDAEFEIAKTETNDDKASIWLKYNYKKEDNGFPFEYSVTLKWSFHHGNKVTVQTSITNNDSRSFPMMDGWHPYFKLGNSIDDCALQFVNNGILEYDQALIPTRNIIPNNQFENGLILAGIELDNGYTLTSNNPTCILENEQFKLVVNPDAQYGYLQLYTPPHRKSIAIENLSAAPDCFNNKMGLHIMQPQEVWSLETSYQLFYK
jgi:aldose 1-epimerase